MYKVGAAPLTALAATIPATVYWVFQLMFAIITPALIIGSIADRYGAQGPAIPEYVGCVCAQHAFQGAFMTGAGHIWLLHA